ncbi:MAG TPA: hypothetical protein VGS07_21305 [Thermoanaerobaculia bacterium]|jgi:hypothetical protein|nr:hypothetical protein [Thermoanaerobaculia bacterium]
MAEKDNLANVDNVEIEPLTDQDLDSVAGGAEGASNTCTCSNCPTFTCPSQPSPQQPILIA